MDYAPNTDAQLQEMLRTIGVGSFEELINTVPADLRSRGLAISEGLTESEVLELAGALAAKNRSLDEAVVAPEMPRVSGLTLHDRKKTARGLRRRFFPWPAAFDGLWNGNRGEHRDLRDAL